MNATKRSATRAGLVLCSALTVALTGCETYVVQAPPRTVYVPAPAPPPPVVVATPPAQPPVLVIQSESDFYEPLGAHGEWVMVAGYGRCWRPAHAGVGWRPYANGYWRRTDAGWYWVSEEPWGWATYHYGRWDFHANFGWIWLPQTQWAPAWVSWREGGGYVGWAPLRPSARIGVVVHEPAFESRAFVFVEHRRMLEPVRPRTVIVNNTTIINTTVNITRVTVVNNTRIHEGPRAEVIERENGRKIQATPVHEVRRREEAPVAARHRTAPTPNVNPTPSPARPQSQPVAHPAPQQPVPPRRGPMVEKPAETVRQPQRPPTAPPQAREPVRAQPTPTPPRPVVAQPARNQKQLERVLPTPAAVASPKHETRREAQPPVRVETAPPAIVKKLAGPATDKPLITPREKSRAGERGEALQKQRAEREQKHKQGEEQETPPPNNSARQPR